MVPISRDGMWAAIRQHRYPGAVGVEETPWSGKEHAGYMSRTSSESARAQQISTDPAAGASSGAGS